MTTPVQSSLEGLIERVKAATRPDRELDSDICIALQYGGGNSEGATNVRIDPEWGDDSDLLFEIGNEECCNPIPELTASTDAALALVERCLPGWGVYFRRDKETCGAGCVFPEHSRVTPGHAEGANLPLAIVLATLLAIQSSETSNADRS